MGTEELKKKNYQSYAFSEVHRPELELYSLIYLAIIIHLSRFYYIST